MLLFMQFLYKYISYWNSKEQNVITWLSRVHRKIILNSTCESAAYTAKYATNSMMININFWGMIIRGSFCVLAKTIQYLNSFNVLMNTKTNWNLNAACCDWITGMSMPSLFMYCTSSFLFFLWLFCFQFFPCILQTTDEFVEHTPALSNAAWCSRLLRMFLRWLLQRYTHKIRLFSTHRVLQ